MKNKNSFLVILFLVGSSWMLHAQKVLTKPEQETFKKDVEAVAKKTNTITSDFKQTKHIEVLDNEVVSHGKLFYKAPKHIRWEYTSPIHYKVIFKDDKLFVNNQGKRDEINLASNRIFKSFNTLIVNSVKGNMFDEEQFEIQYYLLENDYSATFSPKDKRLKKFIHSFVLQFDSKTKQVTEVKMIEPGGDYTLVVFKNRKDNIPVSDASFTID
ncbi:outer membrane lipoprotein carrier protein LolA [Jejudonia soesokkakensis]|uniref:Outer membrane lipoprotein carrier protein LolA n=1 Tax=Jejudonia soesokkakensis TaxID=1323432 RepID=A0ABW2MSN0_9FLAO